MALSSPFAQDVLSDKGRRLLLVSKLYDVDWQTLHDAAKFRADVLCCLSFPLGIHAWGTDLVHNLLYLTSAGIVA